MSETNDDYVDEDGRKPYLVMLSLPVKGYDPYDAAQQFLNTILLHGLNNQTVRATDLVDDETYVVEPDGDWYVDEDEGDPTSAAFNYIIDRLAEAGIELGEDRGGETIGGREVVDVELPPEAPEEPVVQKAKKPKPCVRCKQKAVLDEDGHCPECVADLEGATK